MTKYPPLLKDGLRQVREGDLKPSEWAALCCDLIEAYDSNLKAWSYFDRNQVERAAAILDRQNWKESKPFPALAGAPLGVKDIFNTTDHPNSMGSAARKGYWPGNDARVITTAKLLGAQMLGKTTTAEFAVHYAPETVNPRNPGLICGTSSTGSAVAVATGMVPAALGTQSAGSIARPASYNGIVGFKPSFGMVPRTGVLKTCDTLDTIGWMTRGVEDAQILFSALRVRGGNYPVIEKGIYKNMARFADSKSFKIGLLKAPGYENIMPDSLTKIEQLALQLNNRPDLEVIEIDLRGKLATAHHTHATIYDKSLAYYFQRELQNTEVISPIFKEIVARATEISPDDFFAALDEQERLTRVVDEEFQTCDFFLLPSTAGEAPAVGTDEPRDSSLIWTLTGCPVLSLPLLQGENGYPVGVTLVGPKYSDMNLLEMAKREIMPDAVDIVTPVTGGKARLSA
ncbi:MAG: amidase [Micavibrio aeruginosavorus]|uniref:Amidase n=1 Tax=Micavibrio aeruginosavorus TaxID=349221 RepID=A0A7T5R2F0_9BACT|nr:MAG: amidase [Micavibrio aeruginosavorus]